MNGPESRGGRGPQAQDRIPLKHVLIGIAVSVPAFLMFGIPTDLVPTPFFIRMVPAGPLDYLFLMLTSLLVGAFVALHLYGRRANSAHRGEGTILGGSLGSIVAFGCPICNKLLVVLIGVGGALNFIDPYRPVIGTLSVAAMGTAVYLKAQAVRSPVACSVPTTRKEQVAKR